MAILERTPPPSRRPGQSTRISNGNEESIGESAPRGHANNHEIARADSPKDYVFPSLDALAIPARERKAIPAAGGNAYASTSKSPMVSSMVPSSAFRSPASAIRIASPSIRRQQTNTPQSDMRRNAPESLSRVSPERSPRNQRDASSIDFRGVRPSPAMHGKASQRRASPMQQAAPVVDKAFQDQIERALSSGENPFMDRKRAMMRDEGGSLRQDIAEQSYASNIDRRRRQSSQDGGPATSFRRVSAGKTQMIDRECDASYDRPDRLHRISEGQRSAQGSSQAGQVEDEASASCNAISQQTGKAQNARQRQSISGPSESGSLAAQRVYVEELEAERRKLRSRVVSLEQHVSKSEAQVKGASAQLDETRRALMDREEERRISAMEVQNRDAELQRLQQELADKERVEGGRLLPHLAASHERSRRSFQEVTRSDEALRLSAISEVLARNKAIICEARLQEAEIEMAAASRSSIAELDMLRAEKTALHAEAEGLQSRMEEQDVEVDQLRQDLSRQIEDTKALRRKAGQHDALLRQKEMLEDELAEVQAEMQRANQDLARQREKAVARPVSPPKATQREKILAAPSDRRKQPLASPRRAMPSSSSPRRPAFSSSGRLRSRASQEGSNEDTTNQRSSGSVATTSPPRKQSSAVRGPASHSQGSLASVKGPSAKPSKAFAFPTVVLDSNRRGLAVGAKASQSKVAPQVRKPTVPAASSPELKVTKQGAARQKRSDDSDDTMMEESEISHISVSKTPLLPAKRHRAVNDVARGARNEIAEDADTSALHAKTPIVSKRQAPPLAAAKAGTASDDHGKSENVAPPPSQQLPQQKKKRRLLNVGGAKNVAGDFLNWGGDVEGNLDPKLNLPFELSPFKAPQGSRGPAGIKARMGMTAGGQGIKAGGPGSVFGRR